MKMIKRFILYRIFYESKMVYLGRTKQPLQDRIRGHVFKRPMHRDIDINLVTKIEYTEFKTEADMNVYEIYFINKFKPPLNKDDKARDELTFEIPDVTWTIFNIPLWSKWKEKINTDATEEEMKRIAKIEHSNQCRIMRKMWHAGEIGENEYYDFLERG